MDLVKKGETAVSRPQVLPWLRSQIEQAARERHVAEIYLASPGYVSKEETDKQLQNAAIEFAHSELNQNMVERDEARAFNHEGWKKCAAFGVQGLPIPPEYGGSGLGYLELCVIAEELGRALAPVPFSSSVFLFAELIKAAGTLKAVSGVPMRSSARWPRTRATEGLW